ncbi:MAG: serpin family protein, partial [Lachnospiraceae bacterium]|nr:serpin family protein [Lachnospiraceae bacterium]
NSQAVGTGEASDSSAEASSEAQSSEAVETEASAESTEASDASEEGGSDSAELAEAESMDDSLKNAVNGFNWKLYEAAGDENIFYSAYSIESALAMTDLGADGETKAAIESALGIEDLENFEQQYKLYNESEKSETAKLTTANSIWLDKSLALADNAENNFLKPAEFYFGGELKSVDFKNDTEAVKKEITDWVSEKTENLIEGYQSQADSETIADILNAVYFYGEWQNKFSGDNTYKEDFNGSSEKSSVDMMHLDDCSFRYLTDKDGITGLAVPYSNSNFEMDIFMSSDESKNISDVFTGDQADGIFEALDSAEETDVEFSMPKFTMDLKFDGLKEALSDMGMSVAFSDNADFSKIAENLMISDIAHQAKIEVDEEGSRAAAVTEEILKVTSAMPMEKAKFKVDRPFLFVIRDKETGVIVFTGRVNNL